MKPFLEQSGFTPKKLKPLADLPSNVAGLSVAIISLAAESSVAETVEAVFGELCRVTPRTPVLFVVMLSQAALKGSLRYLAKNNEIEAPILGVEPESKDHMAWVNQTRSCISATGILPHRKNARWPRKSFSTISADNRTMILRSEVST